ncbi:Hypothetical protein SMAX5B_002525 [Scophthalmus maximus]|uniref:Uncharacterized protein n=1 Tax=Scophthalmus maximus TaxID=52904 RepID=A0A2U9AX06_SCOMX|nr:Hypothetical protein SMAX5B_002525 [Scophthalmus maximus]
MPSRNYTQEPPRFIMGMQKRSYDRWTDDEVQALLSIFAANDIQRGFKIKKCTPYVIGLICISFPGLQAAVETQTAMGHRIL